ncbi:YadA family autotransporter adhesin [Tsuneonella sp. HG094]
MALNRYNVRMELLVGASALAAVAIFAPEKTEAQALQPVVDVCTGVGIDDSALRTLLQRTLVPTAQGVENLFDDLLTVSILGTPLLSIPDVNLGVAQTTADLAAGNTVSLQVLDTDGNVVGSGTCNVTTDGYALNTPKGVSIGGNQLTGLGSGTAANAGALDAVAIGNGATTSAPAAGAVAIGNGASVTAANGVALGAGSTNDRGALSGYTAYGISGTSNAAGTVSIGEAGSERQLTNVAPGTAATDAATVGQVQGAIIAATDGLIGYDDGTHGVVTLDGAGGTRITGVAAGTLSASSSDAVNGAQLNATNQAVAANAGAITTLQGQVGTNTSDIATLQGQVTTIDGTVTTLQGQVGTNTGDIATLQGQVSTNTGNIANLQGQVTTIAGDVTTLQGQVATNTGAITTLQGQVATNTGDIATLQGQVSTNAGNIASVQAQVSATNSNLAALDAQAVKYDDPSRTAITLGGGAAGTTIGNLADGALAANSRDAVNGGQLHATNQQVGANTASLTIAYSRLDGLDATVTTIDNRVTANTSQLAVVQAQVANIPVGYVSNADGTTPSATPTDTAAFRGGAGGPVRVTNVAAGTLASGSTDAVNGGQLAATNAQVAANRTDIDRHTTEIASLTTTIRASAVAAVQYSDAGTPTVSNGGAISQDVTFVGADASQPVRVHNVADGTAGTDAVNVRQVNAAVAQLQGGITQALSDANAYTDMRFAEIGFSLDNVRQDAHAGTAAAMALATIPQTMEAGKSMIGGAVGHYRGQTAFGFGVSTSGEEVAFKASGTIDMNGKGGIAVGAGVSF